MALKNFSLFLYGLQVTSSNCSLDFKAASGGSVLQATLTLGSYSLNSLAQEITRALQAADPNNPYTVTVDRTVLGGTQNRLTIATGGTFLQLLFGSGPRVTSSCASLIGFNSADYTGATSYTGASTCGTALIPNFYCFNFQAPETQPKVFGNQNVAASGDVEIIVYQLQFFFTAQFKYIPAALALAGGTWPALINWMVQKRLIEFTPNIATPGTFYEGWLETSASDGQGMGFQMKEMIPDFPDLYDTGVMKFRQRIAAPQFIG
jgi:hypothetical protein